MNSKKGGNKKTFEESFSTTKLKTPLHLTGTSGDNYVVIVIRVNVNYVNFSICKGHSHTNHIS